MSLITVDWHILGYTEVESFLDCHSVYIDKVFVFPFFREILVEESNVQRVDSPVTVSVYCTAFISIL